MTPKPGNRGLGTGSTPLDNPKVPTRSAITQDAGGEEEEGLNESKSRGNHHQHQAKGQGNQPKKRKENHRENRQRPTDHQ